MAKLSIIFTLICLSMLIGNSKCLFQDKKTIIPPFRIYVIEILSGPNANIYEVARASISTTPLSFGIVYVEDAITRAGPGPNSQQLGRVQGTLTTTALTTTGLFEPADVPDLNFLFTVGIYKGSSLNIAGRRLSLLQNQEIPIVGGTGFFRGARGYANTGFISYNQTTDTYLYVYDLYVNFFG